MDISENRRKYLEKLEQVAQTQNQRRQDAFDKSKSASERTIALQNFVGHLSKEEMNELEAIIRNQNFELTFRLSAIQALSVSAHDSEDTQNCLLSILEDVNDQPELRMAALSLLQQGIIIGALSFKRSEYMRILRSIVDDKDKRLRQRAIQILANDNDEYVQRRLLEGIERRSNKLIGISAAIQLLSGDVHADNCELLEEIIKNPPSRSAKKEAVRALGNIPSAKNLLRTIMEDKNEHREVRQMSAVSYQAIAPEEFEKYAKQAIHNDEEYEDFRALSLTALSAFASQESLVKDSSLSKKIERLQKSAKSSILKKTASKYLSK